jgi:hypothetical protein
MPTSRRAFSFRCSSTTAPRGRSTLPSHDDPCGARSWIRVRRIHGHFERRVCLVRRTGSLPDQGR